jgi:hypothetical protein
MKPLFSSAIYVNASTEHLLAASCGDRSSKPIREGKRWVTGYQWMQEAKLQGEALPLIFAQYAELTFWAIATDIKVSESETTYRFKNLCLIRNHRRSDLTVANTGLALPDNFIRSYALVRTPEFLSFVRQLDHMASMASAPIEPSKEMRTRWPF